MIWVADIGDWMTLGPPSRGRRTEERELCAGGSWAMPLLSLDPLFNFPPHSFKETRFPQFYQGAFRD